MATLQNFLVTEYVNGKTPNGFDCYTPVKNITLATKKQAVAYFEGYASQKLMSVYAVYGSSVGQELSEMILSNLR